MTELKNVYFMGKYRKSDKEFLDDVEEGALVIAMEPTHENYSIVQKLFLSE